MAGIAAVAAGVVVTLWFLARQWERGRGSTQFILRVLPAALLLLAFPVVQGALEMLRTFRSIAATGAGSEQAMLSLCASILRTLALGNIAFLFLLGCAAFMQFYARSTPTAEARSPEPGSADRAVWVGRLLAGTSLLAVPSALAVDQFRRVIGLVARVAASPEPTLRHEGLSEVTASIADGLTLSISFGGMLCAALVVAGVFAYSLFRAEPSSRLVTKYSWVVATAAEAFAVLMIAVLASDFIATVRALR